MCLLVLQGTYICVCLWQFQGTHVCVCGGFREHMYVFVGVVARGQPQIHSSGATYLVFGDGGLSLTWSSVGQGDCGICLYFPST